MPYRFLKEKKMGKINLDLVFTYINGFELSMFWYFATTTTHYVFCLVAVDDVH